MDKLTMSTEFFNNLLQYLATKPYVEVAKFIGEINMAAQQAQVQIKQEQTKEQPEKK